jgi:hypothetical protein
MLIGMGVVGLTSLSDCIVGIWLEPIPGCPMLPPIVFVNPTFVRLPPFVFSFV